MIFSICVQFSSFETNGTPYFCSCRYSLLNPPWNALHTIFPYKNLLPLYANLTSAEYSSQPNSLNLVSNHIDQESDHTFFITGYFTKIYSRNTCFSPLPKCTFFVFKALSLLSLHPATKTCISLNAHFNEEFYKQNFISVN